MKSKWLVVAWGLGAGTLVAIGCGGSEDSGVSSSSSSGGTDSGAVTTEAGTDNDTGAPLDSGKTDASPPMDAGADVVINAPEVPIQYGNCAAFTPCGGDPTGSWKLTGGCVREELFAPAKQFCPGFQESNVDFKAKGVASYAGGVATAGTEAKMSADVFIPQACLMYMGIPITCAQIGPALMSQQGGGFDKASCTSKGVGQGCDCKVEKTQTTSGSDTYTVTGNTLKTGAGDTYDICVSGGATKLESEKTGQQPFPAVFVFGK